MVQRSGKLFGPESDGTPNPKPGDRAEGVRCPVARWQYDKKTDRHFIRNCRKCWACRMEAHDKILLQGLAETEVSGQVFFVTLTYGSLPNDTWPDAAKRLNSDHIAIFVKYWKRKGITVRKICVGEYMKSGMAHWHMVLFVPLTPEALAYKTQTVLKEKDGDEWLTEPINKVAGGGLPFEVHRGSHASFKAACDDPERLIIQPSTARKTVCRQTHKSWKHGFSDWQLIYEVDKNRPIEVAGRISYVVKYLQKDCWYDSKHWQRVPWDQLPEHIRQMSNFGPWCYPPAGYSGKWTDADKWIRHNEFRTAAKKLAVDLRDGVEYLPIDEHPFVEVRLYTHRNPPLGGEYFRLTGRLHAQQQIPSKKVVIGGYKRKIQAPQPYCMPGQSPAAHQAQVARYLDRVRREGTAYAGKSKEFIQSDSQHAQYQLGYQFQLEKMGLPPISGRDHSFDRLDLRRSRARRMRTGAFFVGFIEAHSHKEVSALCRRLVDLGEAACKGLVSPEDWPRVKLLADPAAPSAPPEFLAALGSYEETWIVGDRSFVVLDGETLTHVGYLTDAVPWFSHVLDTKADFARAIAGKLPAKAGSVASFDYRDEVVPLDLPDAVRRLNMLAMYR